MAEIYKFDDECHFYILLSFTTLFLGLCPQGTHIWGHPHIHLKCYALFFVFAFQSLVITDKHTFPSDGIAKWKEHETFHMDAVSAITHLYIWTNYLACLSFIVCKLRIVYYLIALNED